MKRTINGKRYDTDTATLIETNDNGYSCSDFLWQSESLYVTKQGQYFLHGEGGANTIYASHHGDSSGRGEDISLLTSKEALQWLSDGDYNDSIDEHFGLSITEG